MIDQIHPRREQPCLSQNTMDSIPVFKILRFALLMERLPIGNRLVMRKVFEAIIPYCGRKCTHFVAGIFCCGKRLPRAGRKAPSSLQAPQDGGFSFLLTFVQSNSAPITLCRNSLFALQIPPHSVPAAEILYLVVLQFRPTKPKFDLYSLYAPGGFFFQHFLFPHKRPLMLVLSTFSTEFSTDNKKGFPHFQPSFQQLFRETFFTICIFRFFWGNAPLVDGKNFPNRAKGSSLLKK